jgi:hypothetical protein
MRPPHHSVGAPHWPTVSASVGCSRVEHRKYLRREVISYQEPAAGLLWGGLLFLSQSSTLDGICRAAVAGLGGSVSLAAGAAAERRSRSDACGFSSFFWSTDQAAVIDVNDVLVEMKSFRVPSSSLPCQSLFT